MSDLNDLNRDAEGNPMQIGKYYSYDVHDRLQYIGLDNTRRWKFRKHIVNSDETGAVIDTEIRGDPTNINIRPILINNDINYSDEEFPSSVSSGYESSVRSNSSSSSDQPLFLSKTPYGNSKLVGPPNQGYVPWPPQPTLHISDNQDRSRRRGRSRDRRTSRRQGRPRDRRTSSSRSRSRDRRTSSSRSRSRNRRGKKISKNTRNNK